MAQGMRGSAGGGSKRGRKTNGKKANGRADAKALIVGKVGDLSKEEKKDLLAAAVDSAPSDEDQKEVIVGSISRAVGVLPSAEAQRGAISEAISQVAEAEPRLSRADVISDAVRKMVGDAHQESKEDVASQAAVNALEGLDTRQDKRGAAAAVLETLDPRDQRAVAGDFVPDPPTTNQIWLIIIWAFAVVFVLSAVALFAAAFWRPDQIQILLTVITTMAGILAGVISGRAIVGGSATTPSGRSTT